MNKLVAFYLQQTVDGPAHLGLPTWDRIEPTLGQRTTQKVHEKTKQNKPDIQIRQSQPPNSSTRRIHYNT